MANTVFQIKRTTVSGRTPNTTVSTNTQYLNLGELALNLTDQKMFTSNGTVYFEIGANLINSNITNILTVNAISANGSLGSAGQILTSNGSGSFWSTVASGNGGSGTPSGSNTQVQFNNSGTFGSSSNFTYNNVLGILSIGNLSANISLGPINYAYANGILAIGGSVNNSLDTTITNSNTGTGASGDFAVYDANGPNSNNFIDMGINSPGWSQSWWTINGPSDGYLYTGNTNLSIGTQTNNFINFFTGGTLATNEVFRINYQGLVIANTTALLAQGSPGLAGQVLASNGNGIYWTNQTGGSGNTSATGNSNIIINTGIHVNTSLTQIDSVSAPAGYSFEYIINAVDNINSHYKTSRIAITSDGTNAWMSEYGEVLSNTQYQVCAFSANISGGYAILAGSGDSANVTVNIQRLSLNANTPSGSIGGVVYSSSSAPLKGYSSRVVGANTTLLANDSLLIVTGSLPVTITLLAANTVNNNLYQFTNQSNSQMIVQTAGTDTINGSNILTSYVQYSSFQLQSTGSSWIVL